MEILIDALSNYLFYIIPTVLMICFVYLIIIRNTKNSVRMALIATIFSSVIVITIFSAVNFSANGYQYSFLDFLAYGLIGGFILGVNFLLQIKLNNGSSENPKGVKIGALYAVFCVVFFSFAFTFATLFIHYFARFIGRMYTFLFG